MADNPINMVILAADDNVGIATRDIRAGEQARELAGRDVEARERIPQGHKVALAAITARSPIVRFGVPVGVATAAIERGQLVHVHNVASQYLNNDQDHFE